MSPRPWRYNAGTGWVMDANGDPVATFGDGPRARTDALLAVTAVNGRTITDIEAEMIRLMQTREAERAAAYEAGMRSVLRQRCIEHRDVPQFNTNARGEGECGACVQRDARKSHEE